MGGINEWPLPRNIAGDSQHIDHFSHHYAAHSLRLLTNFPLPYPGRTPSPSLYLPVGYGAGARPSLILSRQPMHFIYLLTRLLPPWRACEAHSKLLIVLKIVRSDQVLGKRSKIPFLQRIAG